MSVRVVFPIAWSLPTENVSAAGWLDITDEELCIFFIKYVMKICSEMVKIIDSHLFPNHGYATEKK